MKRITPAALNKPKTILGVNRWLALGIIVFTYFASMHAELWRGIALLCLLCVTSAAMARRDERFLEMLIPRLRLKNTYDPMRSSPFRVQIVESFEHE